MIEAISTRRPAEPTPRRSAWWACLAHGDQAQVRALVGTLAFGENASAKGIYFTMAQGKDADAKGFITVLGIGEDASAVGVVFPHAEADFSK